MTASVTVAGATVAGVEGVEGASGARRGLAGSCSAPGDRGGLTLDLPLVPIDSSTERDEAVDREDREHVEEGLDEAEEAIGVALAVALRPVEGDEDVVHLVIAEELGEVGANLVALAD